MCLLLFKSRQRPAHCHAHSRTACPVRSYLFLGGILSSAISAMMLLRLGSWMFGGRGGFAYTAELYGGLAVFIGYVLFDTQVRLLLH